MALAAARIEDYLLLAERMILAGYERVSPEGR